MAKHVSETNRSPTWSTWKGLSIISMRFDTAAATPANVSAPGDITVTRSSSTVYVVSLPQIRFTTSSGTPSMQPVVIAECDGATATIFINSAAWSTGSAPANRSLLTLTFASAPVDGTNVRVFIAAPQQSRAN